MCLTQLNLFSNEEPKSTAKDNQIVDTEDTNQPIKPQPKEKTSKKALELNAPAILTEEDKQIIEIENEYKAHDHLTDIQIIEYIEKIKSVGLTCQKCVLAKTRTQVVFSDGKPTAPIMIIGEGPGENEDLSGIPFVGRAGQLLDRILASGGISREEDVYISNVVKCRPPKNRDPEISEMKACSIYLKNQLELVNAKIILLVGSIATNFILDKTLSITKVRGNWIEKDGKYIMPLLHPAYLLRNPSKDVGSPKWLMWQDIKKVKQKLDELKGK